MSTDNSTPVLRSPEVPALYKDWQRILKNEPTINDLVEAFLPSLVPDPTFRSLLRGVYDDECIEGTMAADNLIAAQMIRNAAAEDDPNHPLASKKLATISKALNVVTRRYRLGRNQRRETVSGEFVSPPADNGTE